MRSKQRIIGLWHDFTCEGWLWDQAFPTLLKHSADLFNLFVDKHVVFRRQSFIECIARFEVKQKTKHSFSHSKTFHLRDVALIIPYFFLFHPFFVGVQRPVLPLSTKSPTFRSCSNSAFGKAKSCCAKRCTWAEATRGGIFWGGGKKNAPKNTGRRWNSAGRSEISGSLEVSM